MTNDQFIVQVVNSLTSDYKLQMLLSEKQIRSKANPLSIENLREELHLQFEKIKLMPGNATILLDRSLKSRMVLCLELR
jgi:hypothetical protein